MVTPGLAPLCRGHVPPKCLQTPFHRKLQENTLILLVEEKSSKVAACRAPQPLPCRRLHTGTPGWQRSRWEESPTELPLVPRGSQGMHRGGSGQRGGNGECCRTLQQGHPIWAMCSSLVRSLCKESSLSSPMFCPSPAALGALPWPKGWYLWLAVPLEGCGKWERTGSLEGAAWL